MTSDGAPSRRAWVEVREGRPLILLGGEPVPPVMFFFNTEVPGGGRFLEPQVAQSARAGVHLYSIAVPWPWPGEDELEIDKKAREILDRFLEVDPEACFILRLRCEGGREWLEANPGERILHGDGSRPMMSSLASDTWWGLLREGLARAVRRFEASRHGGRIIAYHPAGQTTSEWFHFDYWLKGPDYSPNNQRAFRRHLRRRYTTDAALSAAWGRPASLDDARIPSPWRRPDGYTHFHDPHADRDRLDFLEYTNAIIPQRLC